MGDLEDAFLKKNVPGRYSSWTEENDDDKQRNDDDDDENNDNDVSDSEDDEYYFEGLPTNNSRTSSSNMQQEEHQPQLRPSGNTGVKGVLADYREAKQREQLMKEKERLDELDALYQATHPAMRRAEDCIISTNNNNDTNDRDNDSYDEDDDFLKRFRNQRLSELKQQQRSTTSLPPKALFGSLTTVTPEEYVKLVDNMNNINIDNYYLIVHLYESSIQQCQILHSTLDKLASSCQLRTKGTFWLKCAYLSCLLCIRSVSQETFCEPIDYFFPFSSILLILSALISSLLCLASSSSPSRFSFIFILLRSCSLTIFVQMFSSS